VDGLDAGTGGNIYVDVFDSRRGGYIGLLSVFTDVAPDDWTRPFILAIYNAGISAGCHVDPGTGERQFCPDQLTNRQEAAVQIQRALGVFDQPEYEGIFSDMPVCDPDPAVFCWSRWAEEFFRQGITGGCLYNPGTGERRYCPTMEISRSHMAVFLQRTFALPLPTL
ncbi:MAG: S-layer homology domain-containing protein, partial [Rhodothermia bacterium]